MTNCPLNFDTFAIMVDGPPSTRAAPLTYAQCWVRLREPVIQANGRLKFEDDLRSGGLLCFIWMNASVRTELADSMVTPGEPGGD